MFGDMRCTKYQ